MKKVTYVGSSKKDISSFPPKAKQRIMTALTSICAGLDLGPKELKYMATVGSGCYELRLKIDKQYRVFYITKFHEAIYVLHAFEKKTQETKKSDLQIGITRYKSLLSYRQEKKYDRQD